MARGSDWGATVMSQRNLLYLVSLFDGMDADVVHDIGSRCDWMRVDKGAEIIPQKHNSTDVYFVVEGRVAAKGYSLDGKEVTYAEIGAGELFGEFSAIDKQPRSASIQALEESYLARMTSDQLRALMQLHPSLAIRICELLVAKNRSLTNRMFEYSTMAVSQRICAELLRMMEDAEMGDGAVTIKPAPSHYEIATRLSTHREAVSKELGRLGRKGIIKSGRKTIEILQPDRLRQMTSFDFKDS